MSVLFCLLQVKKCHITSAQSFPILNLWLVKSLVQWTVLSVSGPHGPRVPTHAPVKMLRAVKAGVGPSWPFHLRVSGKNFGLIIGCLLMS